MAAPVKTPVLAPAEPPAPSEAKIAVTEQPAAVVPDPTPAAGFTSQLIPSAKPAPGPAPASGHSLQPSSSPQWEFKQYQTQDFKHRPQGSPKTARGRSGNPKREVDVTSRIRSRWSKLCSVAIPALQRMQRNTRERRALNAQTLAVGCRRELKKRKLKARGRVTGAPKQCTVVKQAGIKLDPKYYACQQNGESMRLWPLARVGCFEEDVQIQSYYAGESEYCFESSSSVSCTPEQVETVEAVRIGDTHTDPGSFFIVDEAALVGKRLRKSFGAALYSGQVCEAVLVHAGLNNPPLPCYRVTYDDGDCEDLTLQETRKYVIWGGRNAAIKQVPVPDPPNRGSGSKRTAAQSVAEQPSVLVAAQQESELKRQCVAGADGEPGPVPEVYHFDIGNSCEEVHTPGLSGPDALWYRWRLFVQPSAGVTSPSVLSKVVFHLHPDFTPSMVEAVRAPFSFSQLGWGEFDAMIEIHFKHGGRQHSVPYHLQLVPGVWWHHLQISSNPELPPLFEPVQLPSIMPSPPAAPSAKRPHRAKKKQLGLSKGSEGTRVSRGITKLTPASGGRAGGKGGRGKGRGGRGRRKPREQEEEKPPPIVAPPYIVSEYEYEQLGQAVLDECEVRAILEPDEEFARENVLPTDKVPEKLYRRIPHPRPNIVYIQISRHKPVEGASTGDGSIQTLFETMDWSDYFQQCYSTGSAFIVLEKKMFPCEASRCQFGVPSVRGCFGCTKLLCQDCAEARCGEYGRRGHQCICNPRPYLRTRQQKRVTIAAVALRSVKHLNILYVAALATAESHRNKRLCSLLLDEICRWRDRVCPECRLVQASVKQAYSGVWRHSRSGRWRDIVASDPEQQHCEGVLREGKYVWMVEGEMPEEARVPFPDRSKVNLDRLDAWVEDSRIPANQVLVNWLLNGGGDDAGAAVAPVAAVRSPKARSPRLNSSARPSPLLLPVPLPEQPKSKPGSPEMPVLSVVDDVDALTWPSPLSSPTAKADFSPLGSPPDLDLANDL